MANAPSPAIFAATDGVASRSGDLIILFARLVMGWLFFTNGWMKVMNIAGFVGYLTNLGVPTYWAWPAALAELTIVAFYPADRETAEALTEAVGKA